MIKCNDETNNIFSKQNCTMINDNLTIYRVIQVYVCSSNI
jgi:hypothetical protein